MAEGRRNGDAAAITGEQRALTLFGDILALGSGAAGGIEKTVEGT